LAFLLAHLSDPHIGPLPKIPFGEMLNKRLVGALNWHGTRATIHDMDVLDLIIADLQAQNPDHIALTGDLVNIGHDAEFAQAQTRLAPLGDAARLSIIPGNHDAYIPGALENMAARFSPFLQGDAAEETALPNFPTLRIRQGIALIGVNSGAPSLPFSARGKLGAGQIARLGAMLQKTREAGLFRVVMIHHPPLPRLARFARGLVDGRAMEALLQREGAELVIHGHNHRHAFVQLESRHGIVPILGVASASAVPGTPRHRAEYHLIRIEPGAKAPLMLERRGMKDDNETIVFLEKIALGADGLLTQPGS